MLKKKIIAIISIFLFVLFPGFANAETRVETSKEVIMFSSPSCPHCSDAKSFLKDLKAEKQLDFKLTDYTISKNLELVNEYYENYDVPSHYRGAVPIMFIGDEFLLGFNQQVTGSQLEKYLTEDVSSEEVGDNTSEEVVDDTSNSEEIKDESSNESVPSDLEEDPATSENDSQDESEEEGALVTKPEAGNDANSQEDANVAAGGKKVNLPLIGEIDLTDFSLPVLAIILGVIDGFNVCSLGALVLILGLVIALKSRKRIFALGSVFLLTTGLVYGVMIFLWHQLFTVLAPYLRSLEVVVGFLSILGGLYLLREFYKAKKSGPICSSNNILSRLAPKVEKIFKNKTNWLLLAGVVILFSGAITIIEFPCSAVIPVIFSGVLVEAGVSQALALLYIALFVLFYLLDEVIIFIIAVMTMRIKIVSPKFIVFFNLLASFIFLGLGIFYLFGLSL